MTGISALITFGTSIVLFLLSFILFRTLTKQSGGNKKVFDLEKSEAGEIKKLVGKQYLTLFPIIAVVFVLILYFISWQAALSFLGGAIATILLNFLLTKIAASNSGKVIEETRKSPTTGANFALRSGTVSSLLVLGISLILVSGSYALFKNNAELVSLVLGIVFIAFFLKLSSKKNSSQNSPLNLFSLTAIGLVAAMAISGQLFPDSARLTLYPLIIASGSAISFAIASFFIRFWDRQEKFSLILYLALAINAILFAGAVVFSKFWFIREMPINHLINFYGLALIAILINFFSGLIILLNSYFNIVDNAAEIAGKSEQAEIKNSLFAFSKPGQVFQKIINYYIIGSVAIVAVILFSFFNKALPNSLTLNFENYKLLVGLFIGIISLAIFQTQKIKFSSSNLSNIIATALLVIVPTLIEIFLGPVALGGYIISVVVIGLFSAVFISKIYLNIMQISILLAILVVSTLV